VEIKNPSRLNKGLNDLAAELTVFGYYKIRLMKTLFVSEFNNSLKRILFPEIYYV